MKSSTKFSFYFFCFILFVSISLANTSCKTKEGCGYEEKMAPKTDKSGRLSTKKGKSKLFGK